MRPSNVVHLRAIYAAINAADEATLLERLAEDFTFEQRTESKKLPWLFIYRGRAETIAALRPTPAGQLRLTVVAVLDGGDRVTAQVEVAWERPPDGRLRTWREGHRWTFDDQGRATRVRQEYETPRSEQVARVLPFVP